MTFWKGWLLTGTNDFNAIALHDIAHNLAFKYTLNSIMEMRKLVSIWMTCTLLLITCMPSISLADTCGMSKQATMSLEAMSAQEMIKYHQNMVQKKQHVHMRKDMQTCRIECGCGCHHSFDTLPHLLSPHMVAQVQSLPEIEALNISIDYIASDFHHTLKVAVPPPDLS